MGDWSDPVQRAAVWYVAAFAALVSFLLAGTQLGSFSWSEARAPLAAVFFMALAVLGAISVLVISSRVLTPRHSLLDLVERQEAARQKLQNRQPPVIPTWEKMADED